MRPRRGWAAGGGGVGAVRVGDLIDGKARGPSTPCKHGKAEVAEMLIEAAADLEMQTEDRIAMRPLHCAALAGSMERAQLLLAAAADPAAANGEGRRPPSSRKRRPTSKSAVRGAASGQETGKRFPSAELAEAADMARSSARTLLNAGADPDSTDGHFTALQRACQRREVDMVALLIAEGASVMLPAPGRTHNGVSALHIASKLGPVRMVQTLLDAMADPVQAASDGTLALDAVTWLTRDCVAVQNLLRQRVRERTLVYGWLVKLGGRVEELEASVLRVGTGQLRYYRDEELLHAKAGVFPFEPDSLKSPSSYPGGRRRTRSSSATAAEPSSSARLSKMECDGGSNNWPCSSATSPRHPRHHFVCCTRSHYEDEEPSLLRGGGNRARWCGDDRRHLERLWAAVGESGLAGLRVCGRVDQIVGVGGGGVGVAHAGGWRSLRAADRRGDVLATRAFAHHAAPKGWLRWHR